MLAEVDAYLAPYGRIGYDLTVTGAAYAALDLGLSICVKPLYLRAQVQALLRQRLGTGLLPDGSLALFNPDRLTFGQAVYLSPIIAAAQTIPGVMEVQVTRLDRLVPGRAPPTASPDSVPATGMLLLAPNEIARLDQDPNHPENGRLTPPLTRRTMSEPCGCCAGVEVATPQSEVNPPGLAALAYRVGDYATFYETMLARLSGLTLEIPAPNGGPPQSVMPLKGLTTRDPADPSIALLDAWAVVSDVLTFYQERIANEGYLPTAIERRSLLELSRLIGYRLRPGVAASVRLAFTVTGGFTGTLPAGTRAQSIPGTGESPQFFETSADLAVRDVWNALAPGLTRPQLITPPAADPSHQHPAGQRRRRDRFRLFRRRLHEPQSGRSRYCSSSGRTLRTPRPHSSSSAKPPRSTRRPPSRAPPSALRCRSLRASTPPTSCSSIRTRPSIYSPAATSPPRWSTCSLPPSPTSRRREPLEPRWPPSCRRRVSRIALLRGVAVKRGFTRVTAWLTALLQVMRQPLAPIRGVGCGGLTKLPAAQPSSPLAGLASDR